MSLPPATVAVLGAGYTGSVVCRILDNAGIPFIATRRTPAEGFSRFVLAEPSTWQLVRDVPNLVILFPAEPLPDVEAFARAMALHEKRLVVVSTTSAFLQQEEGQSVDESSPLAMDLERVRGEEYLRSLGAIVLHSGGIYGPGRNPLDWLRQGRIADPEAYVNLIYVEDLAAAVLAALFSSVRGKRYVVTDGTPRRWEEIVRWAREKEYVGDVTFTGRRSRLSRRLSNARLVEELKPPFRHMDLFEELRRLEEKGG